MPLQNLNHDQWRYVAARAKALDLIPGWDWPYLKRSALLQRLSAAGIGSAKVSDLIAESFLHLLQSLKLRRDRSFLEIGVDEAILARSFQRYLNSEGRYVLLHPDPEVVDWVNHEIGYGDARIKAFCLSDIDASDLPAEITTPTYVLDRGQFCEGWWSQSFQVIVNSVCTQAGRNNAVICSLVPLVEFLADDRPKSSTWGVKTHAIVGEVPSYALPIGAQVVHVFDQGRFVAAAKLNGLQVEQVAPPLTALDWRLSLDAACARVIYTLQREREN